MLLSAAIIFSFSHVDTRLKGEGLSSGQVGRIRSLRSISQNWVRLYLLYRFPTQQICSILHKAAITNNRINSQR